jgi:hypothetical protein
MRGAAVCFLGVAKERWRRDLAHSWIAPKVLLLILGGEV